MNQQLTPSRKKQFYNEILHIDPYAYWPLNERNGAVAINHAPRNRNSNNGVNTNVIPGQPGKLGSSYFFSATSTKVLFTCITRTAGQPFSAFAIANPTLVTSADRVIIGVRSGNAAGDLWKIGLQSNNKYGFTYDPTGSGANADSGVTSVVNTSVFLFGTYDGDTVKIYVNGILKTTTTSVPNAAIDQTVGGLGLRADNLTELFAGYIQHAGFCDYAVSAEKILKLARVGGFV